MVTVPAYFNEPRRKATQDAGRLAGLEVIDIINEPTAAAIAYGFERGFVTADGSTGDRQRVLVYDLGGGTFDVTLMEIDGGDFRAVAIAGDVYLGGIDWDERIARHVAEAFLRQHGVDLRQQPGEWERLMHAACDAKLALTARTETLIPFSHAGKQVRLRLTRDEFESLTGDLLERTRLTCRSLLKDAGRAVERPDAIVAGRRRDPHADGPADAGRGVGSAARPFAVAGRSGGTRSGDLCGTASAPGTGSPARPFRPERQLAHAGRAGHRSGNSSHAAQGDDSSQYAAAGLRHAQVPERRSTARRT